MRAKRGSQEKEPPPTPPQPEYLLHLPPEALQAALVLCRLADFFCLTHEVLTSANLTTFKARVGMLKACLEQAMAEGLKTQPLRRSPHA